MGEITVNDRGMDISNSTCMMFSIVIPVYNREQTLRKCLDSVLNQSYIDWEIIIVDDGSTDLSRAICDHMASIDLRIRVFHCEHLGVSASRNFGISQARGEWITFLDSDDWLLPDALSLCSSLITSSADLICISAETNQGNAFCKLYNSEISENEGNIGPILLFSTVWGKLYDARIIRDNRISFNEKLNKNEDTLFVWDYLQHTKHVICTDVVGYCYNISDNASSLHNYNVEPTVILDTADILESRYVYLKKKFTIGQEEQAIIQNWLNSFAYRAYISLYKNKYPCRYRRETRKRIRKLEKDNADASFCRIHALAMIVSEKLKGYIKGIIHKRAFSL